MAGREALKPRGRAGDGRGARVLPPPLPPPPRRVHFGNAGSKAAGRATSPVPPAPHFGTRFAPIDLADAPASPSHKQAPDRSLWSFPVLASLVLSAVALSAVGWISMRSPDGLTWSAVKQVFRDLATSHEDPDDELPYITAVPMLPGTSVVADRDDDHGNTAERLAMSDGEVGESQTKNFADKTRRR